MEFYDFATGQVRQSAILEKRPTIWGFSVSPDERWFLYAQQETELDIMLVENFR